MVSRRTLNLVLAFGFILIVLIALIYASSQSLGTGEPVFAFRPRVGVIRISGAIQYGAGGILGAEHDVRDYIGLIDKAREDPSIASVVIVFNSPGGEASASEELYLAVKKLSEKKPVVAFAEGSMTSGAYEAALPARVIVASPSSTVGAVGVYSIVLNVEELMGKLGIKAYVFKSGPMKDIGSPFRGMTDDEKRVMQELIDDLFEVFKDRVLKHRKEVKDEVFTGRPFSARRGLEVGLVDKIGTFDDAVSEAKRLANLPEDAPVEELRPPTPSLLNLLLGGTYTRRAVLVPSQVILAMWPPPTAIISP